MEILERESNILKTVLEHEANMCHNMYLVNVASLQLHLLSSIILKLMINNHEGVLIQEIAEIVEGRRNPWKRTEREERTMS